MNYQTISLKQFYPAKGAIYYVAIATVIFSHVEITCYFHVWRYVFARKPTWYFIGVYIINRFHCKTSFFAVNKFFGGNFFIGCCRLDHRFVASENILCILSLGVVVLNLNDIDACDLKANSSPWSRSMVIKNTIF